MTQVASPVPSSPSLLSLFSPHAYKLPSFESFKEFEIIISQNRFVKFIEYYFDFKRASFRYDSLYDFIYQNGGRTAALDVNDVDLLSVNLDILKLFFLNNFLTSLGEIFLNFLGDTRFP